MEKWQIITTAILVVGFAVASHVVWLYRQTGTGDFPAAENYWFLRDLTETKAKQIERRLSALLSLAFAAILHFIYGLPFFLAAAVFLFLILIVVLGDKVRFE